MTDHHHDEHRHHPAQVQEHGEHGEHGHGHGADGHHHGVSRDADRRWLTVALGLIAAYMIGEVVVGLLARSLALLSDAAHMLTDAGAIVLALIAMRLAARPPRGGYTFGLKRAEILSAQANGITMLILGAVLAVEAVRRLVEPPQVAGLPVLVTAVAGIGVNFAAVWALSRANRTSLNIEGAFQHILNDLFAFVATAAAGLVMILTGFTRADAIATLLVVALMVRAGLRLVRASGRIFLEAAPSGIDPPALGARLAGVRDVVEVHDLHVWQITSGEPALSAHVLVAEGRDCHAVRAAIEGLLRLEYRITHSTLQVDHAGAGRMASREDPHCADSHGESYRPAEPVTPAQ
ncbi:cation diffusion facilitator family transporter [Dactylosporangium sp. NPDC000555]|uniref:cation diffusion facilitator family transporter n=1 Tax=Dactylosporangium sp. NPDC000555 TaxID=3154260 RepID=UPI003322D85A